jgi:hypothetical protein
LQIGNVGFGKEWVPENANCKHANPTKINQLILDKQDEHKTKMAFGHSDIIDAVGHPAAGCCLFV